MVSLPAHSTAQRHHDALNAGYSHALIEARVAFALSLALTLSVSAQRFALAYITPKRVSNLLSNRVPSPTPKRAWT